VAVSPADGASQPAAEHPAPGEPSTVAVVLGCRPLWSPAGDLVGALGRRVAAARRWQLAHGGAIVVSGGRSWGGVVEADAMHDELVRGGVSAAAITPATMSARRRPVSETS